MSGAGPVLVLGATGFVGGHLVRHLTAHGVAVRGGSRRPDQAARDVPSVTWAHVDLDQPASLREAMRGAAAVVHLVHHMNDPRGDLVARETHAAQSLVQAAREAGVGRILYLGAPTQPGQESTHLLAREATGRVLREGGVPCFELRASMIIGVESASWRIVRDLAVRLPAMVLPRWLASKTQPIAIEDVVAALARCLELPLSDAGIWDLPGPEVMSAREIVLRTAAAAKLRPFTMEVPVMTPALSSTWIRLVTRADMDVARKLVDGLTADLVMSGDGLYALCPDLPRTPFDEAARRTLMAEGEVPTWSGRTWERIVRRVTRTTSAAPPGTSVG